MKKLLLIGLIFSFIASVALAEEVATVAAVEAKPEEAKTEEAVALPAVPVEENIAAPATAKEETDQKKDEQVIKTEEIQKSEEAKDLQLISPDKA